MESVEETVGGLSDDEGEDEPAAAPIMTTAADASQRDDDRSAWQRHADDFHSLMKERAAVTHAGLVILRFMSGLVQRRKERQREAEARQASSTMQADASSTGQAELEQVLTDMDLWSTASRSHDGLGYTDTLSWQSKINVLAIGEEGVRTVTAALSVSHGLTSLDLRHNALGPDALVVLGRMLQGGRWVSTPRRCCIHCAWCEWGRAVFMHFSPRSPTPTPTPTPATYCPHKHDDMMMMMMMMMMMIMIGTGDKVPHSRAWTCPTTQAWGRTRTVTFAGSARSQKASSTTSR